MDVLTHGLFSYGLARQVIGDHDLPVVMAGILPDLDFIAVLINRETGLFAHRNKTHSFLATILGSLLVAAVYLVSFDIHEHVGAIIALSVFAGINHVLFDILTSTAIPFTWPFSEKRIKFDVDRSVNPILFAVSAIFIIVLLVLPDKSLQITRIYIGLIMLSFFLRLCIKLHLRSKHADVDPIPTFDPFTWKLVKKEEKEEVRTISWRIICLYSSKSEDYSNEYSIKPSRLPLKSQDDVATHTRTFGVIKKFFERFNYPLFECWKNEKEQWIVFWYPLEMVAFHHSFGIQLVLDDSCDCEWEFSHRQVNA